jgi:DME family drug/metabolite transporter
VTFTRPKSVRAGAARVQILAASIMWGTTGTAQALAPPGAEPTSVAAVRVVLGGATLVISTAARSLLRAMPIMPLVIATVSLVTAQLSFFSAVDRTGVALGTVVAIGSAPIAAGALGWMFRRQPPGARWATATALGMSGCVLLLVAGRSIDVDPVGILLALVVGFGYAGYTLATKDLVEQHPPDAVIAAVFGVAAVCMAPLLLLVDLDWTATARGLLIALHLGLVTIALAYSYFARGLKTIPAPTAVTLTLAEPLTAGTLGIVVLNEPLTPWVGLGMTMVLAGLLLLTLPQTIGSRWSALRWL